MAWFPAPQKAWQWLTGPPQGCGMEPIEAKRGKRS
jgi:hypothetical protein